MKTRMQIAEQDGDYHLRLLGVLAGLVDRDLWQQALVIANHLSDCPDNGPISRDLLNEREH